MIDFFIAGTLGLLLGIVAGILPGLGTGSLLGILFIFLLQAPAEAVIVFYLGILISGQYFGSVTAILTGVPGDPSAIPSSTYGFSAAKKGQAGDLIFLTAKYSLISALVSFLLLVVILHAGVYWAKSLSTATQSFVFLFSIVLLLLLSRENKLYVNLLAGAAGILLGAVGYSPNYQTYFFVDQNSIFRLGIPWLPVLTGLLIIPGLVSLLNIKLVVHNETSNKRKEKLAIVSARGGILGFILGTVPGLSYILGSIVAAKVEEKISNDNVKIVVASESANNAGAVSMLLPLFLLGIPITVSESMVFTILTSNATIGSIPGLIIDNWGKIAVYYIILNCILFFAAWKFAVPLCRFLFSNTTILFVVALLFSIGGVLWLGYANHQLMIYLVVFLVASVVGILIKTDWTITIFLMLLYPHIETNVYKLFQLYF